MTAEKNKRGQGWQTTDLLNFLDAAPTQFQAAAEIAGRLEKHGFHRLTEECRWQLLPGEKYYLTRNNSALIAFCLPCKVDMGVPMNIVGTHIDSPGLRLKLQGIRQTGGAMIVPTEIYGGPILSTWLDRPLGIAGRIFRQVRGKVAEELVCLPGSAVIPNPAIHLMPEANTKGQTYNPQQKLNAVIGLEATDSRLQAADIMESELMLYDNQPATLLGEKAEILNGSRLDNLLSAYAAATAIVTATPAKKGCMAFFADNEEIGSQSRQGADSDFLKTVLQRINLALGASNEDAFIALASSRLISADAAHALHPNYPEFAEPDTAPRLGQGFALKKNVKMKYASNGSDLAEFISMCHKNNLKYQNFTNRADMPCGSTIGVCLAARLGIPAVDVGVPMLAMHSLRETCAVEDVRQLQRLFAAFWQ